MFENLKAVCEKEIRDNETTRFLNVCSDLNTMEGWANDYLTDLRKSQLKAGTLSVEKAKELMQKKFDKVVEKKVADKLAKIDRIANAPDFVSGTVTTTWKKSSTWGANPTSEFRDGHGYIQGTSIGGCGYDKFSTSVAQVFNESDSLLKALYTVKENNIDTPNRELFGYGSGYGILPYFEGGVGVECFPSICKSAGITMSGVASGKMFDVYNLNKD